jgi:hypothetical protein
MRYVKVMIPFVIAAVAALANSGCSKRIPSSIFLSTTNVQTISNWIGGGVPEN